jgi:hypothetical protein
MKIAVIGWGSLIWCPGSLRIQTAWHNDGPSLPIEFARILKDGRLTLVIRPGSVHQNVLGGERLRRSWQCEKQSARAGR